MDFQNKVQEREDKTDMLAFVWEAKLSSLCPQLKAHVLFLSRLHNEREEEREKARDREKTRERERQRVRQRQIETDREKERVRDR